MARTKLPTTDELIAEYASQSIEERTLWAVMFDDPERAEAVRIYMSVEGLYPERALHDEHVYAIERAELHRFVDALAAVDVHAMHKLAAILIREPITQHIYDSVKRRNDEAMERAKVIYADRIHESRRRRAAARKGAATHKAKALAMASH